MARPERRDVDYFPFYVKDGRTLFILESKYGCTGTGFFTNVMRFLCQQPDHHFQIKDQSDEDYFFAKTKCDPKSGKDMLNIMANSRKIHAQLWVSSRVIVSEALLESISEAYRKRNNRIITIQEIESKFVSGGVKGVSDGSYPQASDVSGVGNPQSKVKERKGKKNKYLDSVFLTEIEYNKLKEIMGQKNLENGIERLDYSITVKGGRYKNHFKTLVNWNRRGFLKSNNGGSDGNAKSKGASSGGSADYPVDIQG